MCSYVHSLCPCPCQGHQQPPSPLPQSDAPLSTRLQHTKLSPVSGLRTCYSSAGNSVPSSPWPAPSHPSGLSCHLLRGSCDHTPRLASAQARRSSLSLSWTGSAVILSFGCIPVVSHPAESHQGPGPCLSSCSPYFSTCLIAGSPRGCGMNH